MGPLDRRLLARARAVRLALGVDVVAGVVATVLLLTQVTILATVVAGVVDGSTGAPEPATLVALAAVILARAGLAHVVERTGRSAATRVMSALRTELVARRLRHGGAELDHLDDTDAVALATSAVQGVDGLETYVARYLPQVVLAVVVPIAVLCWTATVDVSSALIMLVTLPLIPIFMWLIGRRTAGRAAANFAALVTLSAHFLDVVRGLPTLRAFNRGRAQMPRLRETAEQYRRTTMATLRLSFLSGLVLDLATTLSIALVAVTLGVRLVGGTLTLRPALIVLLLVPELYAPIRAVGTLFHASADGLAGVRRILDVLDGPEGRSTVPAADPAAGAAVVESTGRSLPVEAGRSPIELREVSVRFAGRPVPALDRVDLRLEPGELVAVVGPSGAGKTTLGRVLLGLARPDTGQVVVAGHALVDADLDMWRTQVAWSAQRPALLHDTVARNIALGLPDVGPDAIEAAAVAAGAHAFIAELPAGYATVIGDGGRGLSAGQRQRLGLARALLRDAPLLVLDEPSAHLDTAAAGHVATTLERLRGSCTIVLLTHDAALAAVADRVLRLDDGRLATGVGAGPSAGGHSEVGT